MVRPFRCISKAYLEIDSDNMLLLARAYLEQATLVLHSLNMLNLQLLLAWP